MTESEKRVKRNKGIPIYQYDLDDNFIRSFKSINAVVKHTGIDKRDLRFCIARYKAIGGFHWYKTIQ